MAAADRCINKYDLFSASALPFAVFQKAKWLTYNIDKAGMGRFNYAALADFDELSRAENNLPYIRSVGNAGNNCICFFGCCGRTIGPSCTIFYNL